LAVITNSYEKAGKENMFLLRILTVILLVWAVNPVHAAKSGDIEPQLRSAVKLSPGADLAINPKRNLDVDYMNKEVPAVRVVPPQGERYRVLAPDTLDLAERGKLAIDALTRLTEPEVDYEIYFWLDYNTDPPLGRLTKDSVSIQYYFMEPLPLLRHITGKRDRLEVDQRWMETALQRIGPDGLAYFPVKGRETWALDIKGAWIEPVIGGIEKGQYCTYGTLDRLMASMILYWRADRNPIWKEAIERMIGRLNELTIDKGGCVYFPEGSFAPGAEVTDEMPLPTDWWASMPGFLVSGVAKYYRITGHEPARDLAEKLIRTMRDPRAKLFDAEGGFKGMGHLPHHSACVMGMLEFVRATGDQELQQFVHKCYAYLKSNGDPLVGFFPEGLAPRGEGWYYTGGVEDYPGPDLSSEVCGQADMIFLALKLAEMGCDDCWDDADRWIRNQFAESQLLRSDWIYRRVKAIGGIDAEVSPRTTLGRPGDPVAERSIGVFASHPSGNDFLCGEQPFTGEKKAVGGLMTCCTGAGARAIYHAWQHILSFEKGTLRVNLLLNRASPWADVDSYVPYEGRVDVKVKQPCKLQVRIPQWVKPQETTCRVNGESRELTFDGRYAQVGDVDAGDLAAIAFPIAERTVKTTIGGKHYTLIIKGNDIVFIDPAGKWYPFYQRDHYRENRVRWVKRDRFVANDILDW
jgi:hypothetical protein